MCVCEKFHTNRLGLVCDRRENSFGKAKVVKRARKKGVTARGAAVGRRMARWKAIGMRVYTCIYVCMYVCVGCGFVCV